MIRILKALISKKSTPDLWECPVCGNQDHVLIALLMDNLPFEEFCDGDNLAVAMECNNCGAGWWDHFTLNFREREMAQGADD